MDEILMECAQYSASFLVDITHNQDPWHNAYEIYGEQYKQDFS